MVRGELTGTFQDAAVGQARAVEVDEQWAGLGAEGVGQRVAGGQHPARVRQEALSVRGEGHLPGGPQEELHAQLAFQAPDVPAERLLGDVQPGGGTGEVEFLGDGGEGAQEPGFDVVRTRGRSHAVFNNTGASMATDQVLDRPGAGP